MSVNYIDQITDTAGTTHYIAEGVDTRIFTAKCTTAAATADKVATLDDDTGFSLTAGVKVAVTFSYSNTATTPTLNVNNTGAKTIAIPSSTDAYTTGNGTTYNTWGAYYETVLFTYSGVYWVNEGSGYLGYLAYNTASGRQAKITASGILKGDGAGTISAAVAGTDYQAPVSASTITTTTTWSGSGPYTQTVTLSGYTATANTKVDIQLTAAQITQLITDGVTSLLVSNSNGTLTMYATGAAPTTAMTIQATCMEVTAT